MKKKMIFGIVLITMFSCTEFLDEIDAGLSEDVVDSVEAVLDSVEVGLPEADEESDTLEVEEENPPVVEGNHSGINKWSLQDASFSGPLVIKSGGTYTGNYESRNHSIAAISIETSEKVVLVNVATRAVNAHINIPNSGNVEIRNSIGIGLMPVVDNAPRGRYLRANNIKRLIVENCQFEHTAGIYVHSSTPDEIKIRYNYVKNIDGRHRNNTDRSLVQFVQFDKVWHARNTEISWNYVENEPFNSFVEDNISTYASSGVSNDPIRIHNNLIHGAYSVNPLQGGYAGGGILLGDYLAPTSHIPDQAAGYIHAYENVVINTTNYGMAIAGGRGHRLYNNTIVSSGKLPDGRSISAQNVGLYVWNGDKPSIVFQDNRAYGNKVGWMNKNGSRNDWWMPNCSGDCSNERMSGQTVTQDMESQVKQEFISRVGNNNVAIGITQDAFSKITSK